jgi:methyltransferase (TIGR00027 family)
MQQIQSDDLKGVSETLLIPLHFRVQASKSDSSGFKDEMAERFHDAIAYDWNKLDPAAIQIRMMAVRTAVFDEQVRNFLEKTPDGLVVNLGAGLDTRFHRLNNNRVEWIELDLPGVIRLRQKLREPESERHRLIAASILDEDWIAEIKRHAISRVLFVAEGLLLYFTEEEHRKIFTSLAANFPGQEMLFQTIAPSLYKALAQYSHVSKMSGKVEVRWGLEDGEQVSALNPKVQFVREFPLLEGRYEDLPESFRQNMSPAMAKKVAKIVHVRFLE